jgi:hypothetical protein
MKAKIFRLLTASMLLLVIQAELFSQSCINCGTAVNSGQESSAIGPNALASGVYSFALGQNAQATELRAIAIGTYAKASGMSAFAFGNLVSSNAPNTITMGQGLFNNPLTNVTGNSMMIGFNSNLPTLYIGPSDGVNTSGNVGIGTINPPSKLSVNGIVQSLSGGYKFPDGTVQTTRSPWLKNALDTYLNEGNVGIGVNTPAGKLDVYGDLVLGLPGENFVLHPRPLTGDALIIAPQNGNSGWDWSKSLTLKDNGQVYIGAEQTASSQNTNYKLAVNGKIVAKEVVVTAQNWADYVFAGTYELPRLSEVEGFIKQNRHLPDIPAEAEILKEGIDLAKMNTLLLKKVEELTLYVIEQEKKIDKLEKALK